MERKKGKKNQKRKKILDKAWELFRKNGYEETKVEDITRELGVSKGSFYTYFKTKDEVLYEILERIKKENEERISKINVNQEPSKILEDYVISKMNYIVKLLNNMKISSINRNLSNSKLKNFFEELKKVYLFHIFKGISSFEGIDIQIALKDFDTIIKNRIVKYHYNNHYNTRVEDYSFDFINE